jgi:hypothetical protein
MGLKMLSMTARLQKYKLCNLAVFYSALTNDGNVFAQFKFINRRAFIGE